MSTDENGLYYMRQRYYNPEIKRFINQDILTGSLSDSQSLNRYSYVQGNPVSYTDPFGLSPIKSLFTNGNLAHSILGLASNIPGTGMLQSGADIYKSVTDLSAFLYASGIKDDIKNALGRLKNGIKNTVHNPQTAIYNVGNKCGTGTVDNRLVENKFFDNGERIATTKQVRNYKKKMNSLGINVVVDKKEIVLQGDKAAGFDYSTGTIYIERNRELLIYIMKDIMLSNI